MAIVEELKNNLSKAIVPITGRAVSCVLINDNGKGFFGFNKENKHKKIHAEEVALEGVEGKIRSIHLMASGRASDIKNCIPCWNCATLLKRRSDKNTDIYFYFNDGSKRFKLNFFELLDYYKNDKQKKDRDVLTRPDRMLLDKFIEKIKEFNNENGKKIRKCYLTGTASGLVHPKNLLTKKIIGSWYWDLDIIIVINNKFAIDNFLKKIYKESLEECSFPISKIFSKNYLSYRQILKEKKNKNFIFRRIYFDRKMDLDISTDYYKKDITKPSTLDISVGKTLESTITEEYFRKRLYREIKI